MEDFLLDHCRPLLSELDAGPDDLDELPIYRGIGADSLQGGVILNVSGERKVGYIQKVRKDRMTRDTHPQLSDLMDDFFEKKFGWRPRRTTVFAYGQQGRADTETYGDLYRIYPMGKFRYIWGEGVRDLTVRLNTIRKGLDIRMVNDDEKYSDDQVKQFQAAIEKEFGDKYHSTNLHEAITGHATEIMIDCNQYLAVRVKTRGDD